MTKKEKKEKILRNYKYRLYPNKTQQDYLIQWKILLKDLWNASIQQRNEFYRRNKKSLNKFVQQREIKDIKDGVVEVGNYPASSFFECFRKLNLAYDAFWKKLSQGESWKKAGHPEFKNRRSNVSIEWQIIENSKYPIVFLPNMVNPYKKTPKLYIKSRKLKNPILIKIRLHRELPKDGKIKTVSLKEELPNEWYVVFSIEIPPNPKKSSSKKEIGIDVGVSKFITTSDGKNFEMPKSIKSYNKLIGEIAEIQSYIDSNKSKPIWKSSNSVKKAIERKRKLYRKVNNIKIDFHHKLSKTLADTNKTIVFENLNIDDMTSKPKTIERKDKRKDRNIRVGSLHQGWAGFTEKLEYKLNYNGGTLIKVDPAYTSKTCSMCCYTSNDNRKTQSKFECQKCGFKANADHNAAINIYSLGIGNKHGKQLKKYQDKRKRKKAKELKK